LEGSEALLDGFQVVIRTAASLAALQQSLLHNILRDIKKEDEGNVNLLSELFW
jgi:hypothetical protein